MIVVAVALKNEISCRDCNIHVECYKSAKPICVAFILSFEKNTLPLNPLIST